MDKITHEFLLSIGFLVERYFCDKIKFFQLKYTKEVFDSRIIITTQSLMWSSEEGEMPPEYQVEHCSSIDFLADNHTGSWHVYVNSFQNHLAVFYYEMQVEQLISLIDDDDDDDNEC